LNRPSVDGGPWREAPSSPLSSVRFRESRWTSTVESEYGWGFFGLDCDVGDLVWMDSGDFLDKREGFGMWDCFCVVENVRFSTSLAMTDGFGSDLVFRF
jgi:hypothetical protein